MARRREREIKLQKKKKAEKEQKERERNWTCGFGTGRQNCSFAIYEIIKSLREAAQPELKHNTFI